jgi:RimJ/RimL family protein N-acetyltransferase
VEPVELRAPDLLLRVWQLEDAPSVLRAMRDPQIARWNPAPAAAADLAGAQEWVRRRADWSAVDRVSFAVVDRASDRLVGSVSMHRGHDDDASIGYWTMPEDRRRGVASRAVAVVARWAFETRYAYRLELCHAVANQASCAVARRLGFPLEGTLRQSHRYGDGHRHDEHLHARLASDG